MFIFKLLFIKMKMEKPINHGNQKRREKGVAKAPKKKKMFIFPKNSN